MSFGSRRARQDVKFTFDSTGINTYYNLKDLAGLNKPVIIRKLWINTHSRYGNNPVITADTFHVNLPTFYLDEVKEMLECKDDVDDINAGRAAFRVVTRKKKTGQEYLAVEWCDPDPDQLPPTGEVPLPF